MYTRCFREDPRLISRYIYLQIRLQTTSFSSQSFPLKVFPFWVLLHSPILPCHACTGTPEPGVWGTAAPHFSAHV